MSKLQWTWRVFWPAPIAAALFETRSTFLGRPKAGSLWKLRPWAARVLLLSKRCALDSNCHHKVASRAGTAAAVACSVRTFAQYHTWCIFQDVGNKHFMTCAFLVVFKAHSKRRRKEEGRAAQSFDRATNRLDMPYLWHTASSRLLGSDTPLRLAHAERWSTPLYICAFPISAVEWLCVCRSSGENWKQFSTRMCDPHPTPPPSYSSNPVPLSNVAV